jgi:hypothetical protein
MIGQDKQRHKRGIGSLLHRIAFPAAAFPAAAFPHTLIVSLFKREGKKKKKKKKKGSILVKGEKTSTNPNYSSLAFRRAT